MSDSDEAVMPEGQNREEMVSLDFAPTSPSLEKRTEKLIFFIFLTFGQVQKDIGGVV